MCGKLQSSIFIASYLNQRLLESPSCRPALFLVWEDCRYYFSTKICLTRVRLWRSSGVLYCLFLRTYTWVAKKSIRLELFYKLDLVIRNSLIIHMMIFDKEMSLTFHSRDSQCVTLTSFDYCNYQYYYCVSLFHDAGQ